MGKEMLLPVSSILEGSPPDLKSDTLILPSMLAVARNCPSGLKTTAVITLLCATVTISFPDAASETLTALSELAVATRCPSGLISEALTAFPSTIVGCCLPDAMSQTQLVGRHAPVDPRLVATRRVPSGLKKMASRNVPPDLSSGFSA
jgi:hypothetical protein